MSSPLTQLDPRFSYTDWTTLLSIADNRRLLVADFGDASQTTDQSLVDRLISTTWAGAETRPFSLTPSIQSPFFSLPAS